MLSNPTLLVWIPLVTWCSAVVGEATVEYGVDISFPMHHATVSQNYNQSTDLPSADVDDGVASDMPIQPLGNRQAFHDSYMQGCRDRYEKVKPGSCDSTERDRVAQSLRQPQSMRNYTEMGFAKRRAPDDLIATITEFFEKNREKTRKEHWAAGNIYVNHWENPSVTLSVGDSSLEGGGSELSQRIRSFFSEMIQEWTGQQLNPVSLYGVRIYEEGAVLAPHVDRLPLVSSAIYNVAQDVDEPWPLEVIARDGKAYNVTMEPGDIILYESHSLIHGRPFPLRGKFMANIFIHFEPLGAIGGEKEFRGDLPPYVIPGSPDEPHWRNSNPRGHRLQEDYDKKNPGSTRAHPLAQRGNVKRLRELLDQDSSFAKVKDQNGWSPLHEGLRSGWVGVVQLLLEHGADPNARIGINGDGSSALELVDEYYDGSDPQKKEELKSLLRRFGAEDEDSAPVEPDVEQRDEL